MEKQAPQGPRISHFGSHPPFGVSRINSSHFAPLNLFLAHLAISTCFHQGHSSSSGRSCHRRLWSEHCLLCEGVNKNLNLIQSTEFQRCLRLLCNWLRMMSGNSTCHEEYNALTADKVHHTLQSFAERLTWQIN